MAKVPSPIPHDWTPAPCLDLVNSRWSDHLGSGRSYDRLPEPLFRRAFLKRWGYRVRDPDSPGGIARLAALRTVLRRVMDGYVSGRPLSAAQRRLLEVEANRAQAVLRLRRRGGAEELALEPVQGVGATCLYAGAWSTCAGTAPTPASRI